MRGAVDDVRAGPLDGRAVGAEAPGRTGWRSGAAAAEPCSVSSRGPPRPGC
ncbi:hypothetical protein FM106_13560 [Brachybacterium faecium]|nr:hypothetical protein FM106_13560 [Brachybacterium faecium]